MSLKSYIKVHAPAVQTVNYAIHQMDSSIGFPNTYQLDRDLSGE